MVFIYSWEFVFLHIAEGKIADFHNKESIGIDLPQNAAGDFVYAAFFAQGMIIHHIYDVIDVLLTKFFTSFGIVIFEHTGFDDDPAIRGVTFGASENDESGGVGCSAGFSGNRVNCGKSTDKYGTIFFELPDPAELLGVAKDLLCVSVCS